MISLLKRGFRRLFPVPSPYQEKTSPATKISLVNFYNDIRAKAKNGQLPPLNNSGFRIFSQFEEDGLLLFLIAALEVENKTFIDIGSADGISSNCANLAFNFGWHGLFVDGSEKAIEAGRRFYEKHPDTTHYPPVFVCDFVKRENINKIISGAGFHGPIGVMSIDIDGNDYWVWDAIETVEPAIVIIETHIEFGMKDRVVSYDPNYYYPNPKHPEYFGASAVSMNKLAKKKGYRLVGANHYGFNLLFVKSNLFPDRLPEIDVAQILNHPRNRERLKLIDPIDTWEFESPIK
ncbi:hypothetical protein CH373_12200 [Leptospira perolatii]|uniref:Methyltransferase FkbM domain-containing protein n=1 Tax=Leptospira perolatii TaxID=2023191 RepID=A0A2M9ZL75_9LEPT|nr:hypothetical protein [Leptospira perolatii]PJZ70298.1 hypothetical protein CH360_06770 [Leptospira perolatii]PJZ72818.1 hypothetical protein CH373_12200 [Leptospira perolatii]